MTKQQLIAEAKKEYEEKFVNFDGTIDEDAEDVWEWLEEQLEVLAESVRREVVEGFANYMVTSLDRPDADPNSPIEQMTKYTQDFIKGAKTEYLQQESSSEKGDHDKGTTDR